MTADRLPRLAQLAYHDYVALIAYLVEPLSVRIRNRRPDDIHSQIRYEFTRACSRYREHVQHNADGYFRTNGPSYRRGSTVGRAPCPPTALAPFLFNPAFWVAFGRADAVAIAAFDDTDAMVAVMAEASASINQGTLAFCPRMDPVALGLVAADEPPSDRTARARRLFVDLHKLLAARPHEPNRDHPFQRRAPLLVLTRFKMGGIGILAGGLTFQQAAFRTAAQQTHNELELLRERLRRDPATARALEVTSGDLDAVRCTLLDGQGAEDMLLLTTCTNFSVGVALAARLRCMTIGDVVAANAGLGAFLDARRPQLLDTFATLADRPPGGGVGAWLSNHVYSDSYTNLAVANGARRRPEKAVVRGQVLAVPQGDANPGHLLDVETTLEEVADGMRRAARGRWPASQVRPARKYMRFLSGRHDFFAPLGRRGTDPLPTYRLRDYLTYLNRVVAEMRTRPAAGERPETGLMDFTSTLEVPFTPGAPPRPVDHAGHLPVMSMLDRLRVALFAEGKQAGRMGLRDLKDTLRRLGVPHSLNGALELHYRRFREQLADPHLFDGVLDLYDTYATLYAFLAEFLPTVRQPGGPAGKWLCEQMAGLLTALGSAADHRVRLPLPDADRADTAVDVRGGLSKLMAAADVPLKCGMYLVNSAVGRAEGLPGAPPPHVGLPLNRIGSVTQFTFDPQTRCEGVHVRGARPYSLTFVGLGVSHLFRPSRLLDHLHEAAHLVTYLTDDLRHPTDLARRITDDLNRQASCARVIDLIDELYAELLTLLMVFRTNTDLYLKQQVAGYATSPQGQGAGYSRLRGEEHEAEERFYRHLLTAFLVTGPIAAVGAADPRALSPDGLRTLLADRPRAQADFLRLVERYGRLHARFGRWSEPPDFAAIWADAFEDDVAAFGEVFAAAWAAAYNRFRSHDWPLSKAVSRCVGRAVLTGRPIVHPWAGADLAADEPDQIGEAVQSVSQLLYAHAKHCYQSLDPTAGVHLPRNPETGAVDFASAAPPGGRWNVFQLDAPHGDLFCVDPVARRERVRLEVTVLKSLWDVSTHIRAERLAYLIRSLIPAAGVEAPSEL